MQLPKSLQQQIQLFTNTEPKVIPSLAKDLHNHDLFSRPLGKGTQLVFQSVDSSDPQGSWARTCHVLTRPTSSTAEVQQHNMSGFANAFSYPNSAPLCAGCVPAAHRTQNCCPRQFWLYTSFLHTAPRNSM